MVFTFNPQAYLLLREREKAGVEPISKVLIFSTFAAESQFFTISKVLIFSTFAAESQFFITGSH